MPMEPCISTITVEQRKLLDLHLQLVIKENKQTNLTRITSWKQAQLLHVEDSLVGLPEVNKAPTGLLLDIGTGAGYPGIPLAVVTGRETLLVDSVGKKVTVLNNFLPKLGLDGYVSARAIRIEELALEQPAMYSVITARALSSLASLLELASPLLNKNGWLVCYKSADIQEELSHAKDMAAKVGMEFASVRHTVLSDGATKRSIVVFAKSSEPEVKLPRRVGVAQKRPY